MLFIIYNQSVYTPVCVYGDLKHAGSLESAKGLWELLDAKLNLWMEIWSALTLATHHDGHGDGNDNEA